MLKFKLIYVSKRGPRDTDKAVMGVYHYMMFDSYADVMTVFEFMGPVC